MPRASDRIRPQLARVIASCRQPNTTKCRLDATFLSLTLLISFINCHGCAAVADRKATADDFDNVKKCFVPCVKIARSRTNYVAPAQSRSCERPVYAVTTPKVWRLSARAAALRFYRCWRALRSPCSPACRFSRSRFAPRRPPSSTWADSSRLPRRRACRWKRSSPATG